MGRAADIGIMHPKSIGNLLHRIITGLIMPSSEFGNGFYIKIERFPQRAALGFGISFNLSGYTSITLRPEPQTF